MWLRSYLFRVLIAVDQGCNVVFLNGEPDETVSARAWRLSQAEWGEGLNFWLWTRTTLDRLFFWDWTAVESADGSRRFMGHCEGSYLYERARFDLPPEYREEIRKLPG